MGRGFGWDFGPGGFGPGFGPGFAKHVRTHHGGGRARRGDVRAAILALLSERPMHGYEIIRELVDRSSGVWQPSPGSVYPTLQMLEDEGLVHSIEESGKRLFELTDSGRTYLEENPRTTAPWDEVAQGVDPVRMQLREAIKHTALATMQVAEVGTDAQRAEALRLLTELRRQLYALLAADEAPTA